MVIMVVLMLLLLAGGALIAATLGVSGLVGMWITIGARAVQVIGQLQLELTLSFVLAACPMFIFMGELITMSGVGRVLYHSLSRALMGAPGGLVQTNIAACTVFAAFSGSSVAGAATIGSLAWTDQVQRGYSRRLVAGSIAAGGTLGILIPPSVPMILYGVMADQSVAQLYMAGVIPGLLMAALFAVYVAIASFVNPTLVPQEARGTIKWYSRLSALGEIWPFVILIVAMLGSIYLGIATPTEAAAIGVVITIMLVGFYRRLTWPVLKKSALITVRIHSMIIFLVIGAKVMATASAYLRIPFLIAEWGAGLGSPILVFAFVVVLYLILGCFFDAISMMVLTIPFVMPLILNAGYNGIWFGIQLVILIEMGMLTPPVGLNVFTLEAVTGEPSSNIYRAIIPFLACQMIILVLLYFFPQVALWLPSRM